MTGQSEEHDFEAFLKTRSILQSPPAGRDRLEPPAEIDQQVLATASRAIRAPTAVRLYRAPRWALPAGLAAILLVSIAIVVNVDFRGQRPLDIVTGGPGTSAAEQAPAAGAPAAPAARAAQPPAGEWLERIARLRKDGQAAEADAELERFRQTYPHYPVPSEAARSPGAPSSP